MKKVRVYAPATIGNIGPGFDVLGMAITNLGDHISVWQTRKKGVEIADIIGGEGIPMTVRSNTAGLAAHSILKRIRADVGVALSIEKGVPPSSGLGSSAASAVAAGYAVNYLFGNPLAPAELLQVCTEAEAAVSGGFFADNTAAALFGGAVLARFCKPPEVVRLGAFPQLALVVACPDFKLTTQKARAVLPKQISIERFVKNMGNTATVVAAFARKDLELLGRAMEDHFAEPARARLIPGFRRVKDAALKAGALGCAISGAGPSLFAVTRAGTNEKRIGAAMKRAFEMKGLKTHIHICSVDRCGARWEER